MFGDDLRQMLTTLAIANYRSIRQIVLPLGRLNVVTGANGSGKSNLYRALRLLSDTARGGIIGTLAREGGLDSTLWAGPETLTRGMKTGAVRVQGAHDVSTLTSSLQSFDTMLTELNDPRNAPEISSLRDTVRAWRFYDHFRVDGDAPARQPVVATRTPVLAADGRDLVAALETIREIGDAPALAEAIDDAFPGARMGSAQIDGRLKLEFTQPGLLRPLSAAELSDGTLRYLLWAAALMTPRPPPLMVLNEPETSLHPDLLPALGRLISRAARNTQVWVVSHANRLVATLREDADCNALELDKELGETVVRGRRALDEPDWSWPER